jgi:hypothetical protein
MGQLAAPLSIASVGFSALGKVSEGQAAKAGYEAKANDAEFAAQRAERAAEYGRIQADQTDAGLREELAITLGNIDAVRAASNVDPTSPSGVALKERETEVSDRQRRARVASIRAQANEDDRMAQYGRSTATYLRRAGSGALRTSYINAAAGITGGIAKGFSAGSSGKNSERY